jgi:hypothetical protein
MTNRRSPRWAPFRPFDIPDRNNPSQVYLRRYRIVETSLFGVYLHRIYLPDVDRDPHDHPWKFWSWLLRGAYREAVSTLPEDPGAVHLKTHLRWSLHHMPLHWAHRITHVEPGTTTLVIRGPRRQRWGFWTKNGFVDWADYEDAGVKPDPDPFN